MTTTVVLVDDQALVRGGFRMILEAEDDIDVVDEASDGDEAVTVVCQLRPDVVFMDVQMPRVDGLEATRRIVHEAIPTRVVILTTFERDDYVFDALRIGASGFLLKNAPPEDLVHAVRVVAASDALLAPSVTREVIEGSARRPLAPGRSLMRSPPHAVPSRLLRGRCPRRPGPSGLDGTDGQGMADGIVEISGSTEAFLGRRPPSKRTTELLFETAAFGDVEDDPVEPLPAGGHDKGGDRPPAIRHAPVAPSHLESCQPGSLSDVRRPVLFHVSPERARAGARMINSRRGPSRRPTWRSPPGSVPRACS